MSKKFEIGDLVRITEDECGAPVGALVYVLDHDNDHDSTGVYPGFYYLWHGEPGGGDPIRLVASDHAAELVIRDDA